MPRRDRRTGPLLAGLLGLVALVVAQATPTDLGVLVEMRRQAWEALTGPERDAFRQRLAAWEALPIEVAGARREHYLALESLDGAELALLRQTGDLFEALPAATQADLRDRFAELSVTEQRGWLLGPQLGADYAALQPLLAQVPPDEHADLLRVLRAMTPPQRHDLSVLVQRTPPQERAQLRRELVSTAAGNRNDWLWDRLHR